MDLLSEMKFTQARGGLEFPEGERLKKLKRAFVYLDVCGKKLQDSTSLLLICSLFGDQGLGRFGIGHNAWQIWLAKAKAVSHKERKKERKKDGHQ